jgi:hypothetical protein
MARPCTDRSPNRHLGKARLTLVATDADETTTATAPDTAAIAA